MEGTYPHKHTPSPALVSVPGALSPCGRKERFLIVPAEKETTWVKAEEFGASVRSNKAFLFFTLTSHKNNGVRKRFENELLRGQFLLGLQMTTYVCFQRFRVS